jgi:hypothetical protein
MEGIKQFFACDSIYVNFRLLHKLSKLFGFTAYKFDFKKGKKAYFDFSSCVTFVFIILAWICIDFQSAQRFGTADEDFDKENFVSLIFTAHAAISPTLFLITILIHNLRKSHVTRFLREIYFFDEKLKNLQWKFQFRNQKFFILIVVGVTALLVGVKSFYVIRMIKNHQEISFEILAVILDAPIYVVTMSNLLLCSYSVLKRFEILRKNFASWQVCGPYKLWVVKSLERDKKMFWNLTKLYGKLMDALDEVNSVFTIQVTENLSKL